MSHRVIRVAAAALLALSLGACASSGARSSGRMERSSSTTIVGADLRKTAAPNLYQAIQAIHPEWFRRPGATPIAVNREYGLAVYVDNLRAGGVEVLEQTSVTSAASVRYYSASEAQARFGNGNMNGVIQIVTPASGRSP